MRFGSVRAHEAERETCTNVQSEKTDEGAMLRGPTGTDGQHWEQGADGFARNSAVSLKSKAEGLRFDPM